MTDKNELLGHVRGASRLLGDASEQLARIWGEGRLMLAPEELAILSGELKKCRTAEKAITKVAGRFGNINRVRETIHS